MLGEMVFAVTGTIIAYQHHLNNTFVKSAARCAILLHTRARARILSPANYSAENNSFIFPNTFP